MHLHLHPLLRLLILVTAANGAPVIAARILHRHGDYPVDAHMRWLDGQPLFGPSKTVRGILISLAVTTGLALLMGLPWTVGALVSSLAMAGDLVSSFTKRRMRMPSGSRATGLDQVPESLLPLAAAASRLPLSAADILIGVAAFFAGEIVVSRILYRMHVRDRPY